MKRFNCKLEIEGWGTEGARERFSTARAKDRRARGFGNARCINDEVSIIPTKDTKNKEKIAMLLLHIL